MSYLVILVKPQFGDKLKAITDDGVHGIHNCSFPVVFNNKSRLNWSNVGTTYEVENIDWNGKFYELDVENIIRELPKEV